MIPMVTFILPGWSVKNKEWLEETAMALKVEGFVRPIFWEHWKDESQNFDAKEKATLISRHTKGDTINIVAKSIGILVAAHIIEQVPAQIHKVIICGIPLHDTSPQEHAIIKRAIGSLDEKKLICLQNVDDPHASFAEVKKFLPHGVNLISEPRSDHNYPYYTEFNKFLSG